MQITLMRHGKPRLPQTKWLAPHEMEQWIGHYDRSEVELAGIPLASVGAARNASTIVASTAPRALSSVRALGHHTHVADALFCEAPLPFALWRFPRLPPQAWAAFFRVLWFFGYSRGSDSIHVTKARAKAASERLIGLTSHGPVLLVGHGIMNRLVARELLAAGWVKRTRHESKYWSTSVYDCQSEPVP